MALVVVDNPLSPARMVRASLSTHFAVRSLQSSARLIAALIRIVLVGVWRLVAVLIDHAVPLILKLAIRNLFHDRIRFFATIIGVVFAIVLVIIQMGLFVSFRNMIGAMIDHAAADLWVVSKGTNCFECSAPLDDGERFRALSVKGVADVTALAVGFAEWRVQGGKATPVFIIGSPPNSGGLDPWNLVAGDVHELLIPGAVAIDRSYSGQLKSKSLGDIGEIRNRRVRVLAVTNGIRSFTTTPYIFAPLDRARAYIGLPASKDSYLLVRVEAGFDVDGVRRRLQETISNADVLTPDEFRKRSRSFWLFGTGAGAALFAGALLGIIVGTVVVAQTLYSSTKDHLTEFATLRAIGSSGGYIRAVILIQALVSAVIGFSIAAGIGMLVVKATAETALPISMPPTLTWGLLLLTIAMCVLASMSAIAKVMRTDPAMVFAG
jgi:putative ABC transport system permease protein